MIQNQDEVFFVPEWERSWYLALGFAAGASTAHDPRVAAMSWAEAERLWQGYIDSATAAGGKDLWLPIARARRDHAKAEVLAAQKRAASLPIRPGRPIPDTTERAL